VRFRFIAAEKAAFPVRVLCRTLQVSRAGFYAWQARPPAPRVRGDAATLREPTDSRGARGARVSDGSQARGAAHAGSRAGRPAPPPVSSHDAVAASVSHRPQRAGAAIRADGTGPGVGHRHHLHSDGRGVALPGGHPRSLFAPRRWLGDERAPHGRPHARRARDGPSAPAPAAGTAPSFRSRQSGTPAATTSASWPSTGSCAA